MLNLKRFEVEGLHGWEKNIVLDFDSDDPVTFVTGRNGSGKTTVLKLIEAVANQNWSVLVETEFRKIAVELVGTESDPDVTNIVCSKDDDGEKLYAIFAANGEELLSETLPKTEHEKALEYLQGEGLIWRAHCNRHWASARDSHMYASEVVRVHADQVPRHTRGELSQFAVVQEINESFSVHLIETSRLYSSSSMYSNSIEKKLTLNVDSVPASIRDIISVVDRKSAVKTEQLLTNLFENALYEAGTSGPSIEEVDELLIDLSRKQQQLAELGSHTATNYLPEIVDRNKINSVSEIRTAKRILESISERWVPYMALFEKLNIFREMFGSVCPNMRLEFTRTRGLLINNGEIKPCDLSSGQQHQLLMLFTLIFERENGQLILIDEPEMSMDIEWQREISGRLAKISELNSCLFLLATHSYDVLGDSDSRTDLSA